MRNFSDDFRLILSGSHPWLACVEFRHFDNRIVNSKITVVLNYE